MLPLLNLESVLQRQPGAEACQLEEATVLLDASGATARGLDATGARVWELVDGKTPVREIVSTLTREFDGPPESIERDVLTFLLELQNARLIFGDAR